ncbi:response regulator [Pseudomonas tritici]|uniref:response regulator n=1 Tax=Pseudomonas tritici TaxID=2745518 RepID=UPI00387B8EAB
MRVQRICLVDDSKGMHASGNRFFVQQLGKDLVVAVNGFEAMDVILSNEVDACFIDVEMPELNGLQLVSILRGNPKFDKMPIAMLSSSSNMFDQQKGLIAGANFYVAKPFSKESIEQVLLLMEALHD